MQYKYQCKPHNQIIFIEKFNLHFLQFIFRTRPPITVTVNLTKAEITFHRNSIKNIIHCKVQL